jgi:hypothetical protein
MDRPMPRWKVVIGIGVLIFLISLFADPLSLGRTPGFGRVQTIGVVVGALVVAGGVYLWRRGKMSPWI